MFSSKARLEKIPFDKLNFKEPTPHYQLNVLGQSLYYHVLLHKLVGEHAALVKAEKLKPHLYGILI